MADQPGKNVALTIDGSAWTAYTDTFSFDRLVDIIKTSAFGDSDHTSIAGLRGFTLTMAGNWDPAHDALAHACDDGAIVALIIGPEGSTSGDVRYTINGLLASYKQGGSADGKVTWAVDFTCTGAVTRNTF